MVQTHERSDADRFALLVGGQEGSQISECKSDMLEAVAEGGVSGSVASWGCRHNGHAVVLLVVGDGVHDGRLGCNVTTQKLEVEIGHFRDFGRAQDDMREMSWADDLLVCRAAGCCCCCGCHLHKLRRFT